MKPQSREAFSSHQSKLVMRKDSHTISKIKPKIRIIHIFAPEIIIADVENFRETVQRLTGKPTSNPKKSSSSINPPSKDVISQCPKPRKDLGIFHDDQTQVVKTTPRAMKREVHEESSCGEGTSHSYLHGFGDMDCFNIQDLVDLPQPLSFKSSQTNAFGEMPLW